MKTNLEDQDKTEAGNTDLSIGTDATVEETTEAPVTPQSSKLQEYAKSKFPDQEFEGDDAIAEALISHNSELEGKYTKSQEVTKKLIEIFEAYPEFKNCVTDIIMGSKPRAAIARYYSNEDLTPQEGDDDHDSWATNVKEREASLANNSKFRDELQANHDFSEQEWEAFKSDCGLNEEKATEFIDWCNQMLNEIYSGKISKVSLMALKKGWIHDEDVEDAEKLGELKGKNAKIKATKDIVKKGDGMPQLTTSGDARQAPVKEKSYFGKIADDVKSRQIL